MTIKAIETEYNGYKFRSRLEARWAVFFDVLGIEYQYEAEGFEGLNGVRYLPDFYFPSQILYAEVKGTDETLSDDWEKISACIDYASTPVANGLLILGDIPNPDSFEHGEIPTYRILYHDEGIICDIAAFTKRIAGQRAEIVIGRDALLREIINSNIHNGLREYSSYGESIPDSLTTKHSIFSYKNLIPEWQNFIRKAYKEARQARFEHGETPVIHHE